MNVEFQTPISPNKTVEGAIGGVASSLIIIGLLYVALCKTGILASYPEITSIPWYHVIICTFICTIFSQIGDLVASAVKRFANIKDFSQVLGGHGGLIDRLDSTLFSSLTALVYYNLFIR